MLLRLRAVAGGRNAFREYVACKWPLRIYSVDPVLDQQNVLDAYSRWTELQLALAVAVATGQFNVKNATSYARQLDLDLQTVGLNRTSVGFGAGETTFGWMFYPRVQTPQPVSNFRNITNILTGTGQGINADLRSRRIEPGRARVHRACRHPQLHSVAADFHCHKLVRYYGTLRTSTANQPGDGRPWSDAPAGESRGQPCL